jgi:hypothetical protein
MMITPGKKFAILFASLAATITILPSTVARSYPILDAVVGLPDPELVTVYPDDVDKNLYYFVPTTMSFVFDGEKPKFGVQYWGLTEFDRSGVGAAVTASIRPAFDAGTVKRVADGLKKVNPASRFAFPTLLRSNMDLIVNGAFAADKQDTTIPTVKASTVDGTQAFSVAVNSLGARAFAQGLAAESAVIAARYRFAFNGVEKRLHAKVTIYTKRVYDHFANSGGANFFGFVRAAWAQDWKQLTTDGWIKLEILEGGEKDTDAYIVDIFKRLAEAKIAGEGMFKPVLQPANLSPSAPSGGSGLFGMQFVGSHAWEHLDEQNNFVFEINTQKLAEREFEVGLTFSGVCAQYPDHFVDLSTMGAKCVDKTKFAELEKRIVACLKHKQDDLLEQRNKGAISFDKWASMNSDLINAVCIP